MKNKIKQREEEDERTTEISLSVWVRIFYDKCRQLIEIAYYGINTSYREFI
jgi:hypothetical protein